MLTCGGFRFFVKDGGLASYGVDLPEQQRRAATYADHILRGAKPGDLPVQLPTKFESAVNASTAKALGLEIPPALLATADEVVELGFYLLRYVRLLVMLWTPPPPGPVLDEGLTTCCYAKSEKSWITDPSGIAWEAFLTHGESTIYGHSAERAELRAHAKDKVMAAGCCGPSLEKAPAKTQAACCG